MISLISLSIWVIGAVVATAGRRVRRRLIATQAAGFVIGAIVASTGSPPRTAVPAGLIIGSLACIASWWFVRTGVTFELSQDKTYWKDDGPTPRAEKIAVALAAIPLFGGIAALAVR
jgi:hypothetical protein